MTMWFKSSKETNAPVNLDNVTHVETESHVTRTFGDRNFMILFHAIGNNRITWKYDTVEERHDEWEKLMDKIAPKNKGGRPPKAKKAMTTTEMSTSV